MIRWLPPTYEDFGRAHVTRSACGKYNIAEHQGGFAIMRATAYAGTDLICEFASSEPGRAAEKARAACEDHAQKLRINERSGTA
jgi:hypothetical protein